MPASSTVVPRRTAVSEIVGALADRTAFVVLPPRGRAADVAGAMRRIEWVALMDNGTHAVARTTHPRLVAMAESLGSIAAVFLVPKTVPAADLGRALGSEIPDDGSRDLLLLADDGADELAWPDLFVAALQQVDAPWAQAIIADATDRTVAAEHFADATGVQLDDLTDESAGRIATAAVCRALGNYADGFAVHPPLTAEETAIVGRWVERDASGILTGVIEAARAAERAGVLPPGRSASENAVVRYLRHRFAEHLIEV